MRKPPIRCKYCGRLMRVATIPNRGPVWVHHDSGGRAWCDRLRATGRDIVSNQARIDAAKKDKP
jgi:hypothetical protein